MYMDELGNGGGTAGGRGVVRLRSGQKQEAWWTGTGEVSRPRIARKGLGTGERFVPSSFQVPFHLSTRPQRRSSRKGQQHAPPTHGRAKCEAGTAGRKAGGRAARSATRTEVAGQRQQQTGRQET